MKIHPLHVRSFIQWVQAGLAVNEASATAIHKRLLGPDDTYEDLAGLTSKNVDRTMERLGLEV